MGEPPTIPMVAGGSLFPATTTDRGRFGAVGRGWNPASVPAVWRVGRHASRGLTRPELPAPAVRGAIRVPAIGQAQPGLPTP